MRPVPTPKGQECNYSSGHSNDWEAANSPAKGGAGRERTRQRIKHNKADSTALQQLQALETEYLQLKNTRLSCTISNVDRIVAPEEDTQSKPAHQSTPEHHQYQDDNQQPFPEGSGGAHSCNVPGPPATGQSSQWDKPDVGTMDTFTLNSNGKKDMTMPSKLTALHEDLALQSVMSTTPTMESSIGDVSKGVGSTDATFVLLLPAPRELLSLLQIYFVEHNLFFPCVDRKSFEAKLLKMLIDKGYGRGSQTISLSVMEASFGALLCVILALAIFINPQEPVYKSNMPLPAHTTCSSWHHLALSLSALSQTTKIQGLDILRFHLLEAMYLVNSERLAESSRTLVTAVDMAIRMGLNRQKTWEASNNPDHNMERKTLWWSLYYMDRKIAEKCSRPYFIRDAEVDVQEFSFTESSDDKQGDPAMNLTNRSWELAYLQTLVDWARLWGKIWDTFFAARAQSLGNVDELEAMDARVEGVRRRLSPEVRWDPSLLECADQSAEHELQIRARLLVLIRFNLLRLNLRHNPVTKPWHDQYALSFCGSLAIETVNTLVSYLDRFPNIGQLGFFITVALVECICQLIPSIIMGVSQPDRDAAIGAVKDAQKVIHLVSIRHAAAMRAEMALSQVFSMINVWLKNDDALDGQDFQLEPGSGTITPKLFDFLCDGDIWNFEPEQFAGIGVDSSTGDFSSTLKTFLQDSSAEQLDSRTTVGS
ncbi:hypothetical protein AYL99_00187 [Fonsecaea erecta]|uniref:Xylanolytic transcriptional activator regulatory domain-containing protein n=1 Tax=Fonsecaea erecta TaxID=1367422 RepID=A0A178ZYW6_9EURO|nr:hypothetical protein AYL99_00187 [Fonsecaea erecta]OAP64215.1 hypothetical protein AYL99_00187 [Fonsecaea erecta]